MVWSRNPNTLDSNAYILRHRGKRRVQRSALRQFWCDLDKSSLRSSAAEHEEQPKCPTNRRQLAGEASDQGSLTLLEKNGPRLSSFGQISELGSEQRLEESASNDNCCSGSATSTAMAVALLRKLIKFQARLGREQKRKLTGHKRYVCGLRECLRLVRSSRCLLLIVPSDLPETCPSEELKILLNLTKEKSVPVCRKIRADELAGLLRRVQSSRSRSRPACCVGIKSFEGAVSEMRQLFSVLRIEAEALYPIVPPVTAAK
ncbi:hypothetical protein CCYA_CCYA14G3781 [Cyanidiococcus yangmingshanensis]|nr:hypothetical protein CCYA_CCYA14G3781 [Cyanidiococcus yangmingshanensis]